MFIDWPAQREKTRRLLRKLSVEFDIDAPVSTLRPVDRSAIAIAKALDDDDSEVRVLVLDEPTAALPPHEVELLFGLVRQASEAGTSVIYVSHRLNEIFELADRATILRDGVNQGTVAMSDVDPTELVRMIVGEAVEIAEPHDVDSPQRADRRCAVGLEADRHAARRHLRSRCEQARCWVSPD